MQDVPAPLPDPPPVAVWVVAGAPGAGKSTVAQALAAALRPAPALLDKDVLFSGLVAEVLAAHGRSYGEREGPWYDEHVKRHEYAALSAAARLNREAGCPVVLVAPFTQQVRDPGRWQAWLPELGGSPVHLVWVRCDEATLRSRLGTRGRGRDAGKLDGFAAFVARTSPDVAPPVPHLEVDNRLRAPAVAAQVQRLVAAVLGDATDR